MDNNVTATNPSKLKIAGKILLVLVIIFVALPILMFIILNIFSKDDKLIDDSSLTVNKIEINDEDNSYNDIIKIADAISLPSDTKILDKYISGESWDENDVKAILDKNSTAFSYFDLANNKPIYQMPAYVDPCSLSCKEADDESKIVNLGFLKNTAKLESIKADYYFRQGKEIEALDETIKLLNMGQKNQNSQGTLISYLVASDVKNIGLERFYKIVIASKLSPEILSTYTQKLDQYKDNKESLKTAFKIENIFNKCNIQYLTTEIKSDSLNFFQKLTQNFYFKPNKTMNYFTNNVILHVNSVQETCDSPDYLQIRDKIIDSRSSIEKIFTENLVGKTIADINLVSLISANNRHCEEDFDISAIHLALAIKKYYLENSAYPETLDILLPKYIQSIPIDPFDGKPIKYSKEKKIIYSVGPVDNQKTEDYTFNLNF